MNIGTNVFNNNCSGIALHTVRLLDKSGGKYPKASGLLISINRQKYLLTALHVVSKSESEFELDESVFDNISILDNDSCYPAMNNSKSVKKINKNNEDVLLFMLLDDTKLDTKEFLIVDYQERNYKANAQDHLYFYGYKATSIKRFIREGRKTDRYRGYGMQTSLKEDSELYYNYAVERKIVLFRNDSIQRKKTLLPQLKGMSGGGAWKISMSLSDQIRPFTLISLLNVHDKSKGIVNGTKFSHILNVIENGNLEDI